MLLEEKLKELKVITINRKFNNDEMNSLNYTINNDADLEDFINIYNNNKKHKLSYILSQYKNFIRGDKTNYASKIYQLIENLEILLHNKEYGILKRKLENIFLMQINDDKMDYFLSKIQNNKITIKDVIEYHVEYPNRNFVCALIK